MTVLEYFEKGIMKDLLDKGFVSLNLYTYYRYYLVWKAYKAKGLSNNKAYTYASDETGVSEITVRKAVRLVLM